MLETTTLMLIRRLVNFPSTKHEKREIEKNDEHEEEGEEDAESQMRTLREKKGGQHTIYVSRVFLPLLLLFILILNL